MPRATFIIAPLLVLFAGLPVALAQEAAPAAPAAEPTREAPSKATTADVNLSTATAITRIALIDVLSRGSPNAADMKIGAILLSFAETLTPDDEQLVRWLVQLALSGNDRAAFETKLRRLLDLNPTDTGAQLKLITARIQKIQTAEGRIEAYERVLGEAGSRLNQSVRSHLALDLAMLYHNRGDRAKCAESLKLATSLDSTNKDAAAFSLTFFSEKVDDPKGRLQLLANLLYSDPIDPTILTEMCHEFAAGGAFAEAARFLKLSDNVRARAGQQQDTTRLLEELSLAWCTDGAATIVDRMNTALLARRAQAEGVIKEYEAAQLPTVGLPTPEQVRLEPTVDRVRLIAARAAGDTVTADLASASLRATYEETIYDLTHPASGVIENPEHINKVVASLVTELAAVLGWCDSQTDRIAAELAEVAKQPGFDPQNPTYLEAVAWNTLRTGDAAKAAELFTSLSDGYSSARIGLATAYEALGRNDDAALLYRSICRQDPLTVEACWAYTRFKELTGNAAFEPDLAQFQRTFAATIPTWLEELTQDPTSFMELTAEVLNETPAPLERTVMRITITNRSQLPLALGPGQTIDSRIMLAPSMQIRSETARSGMLPDILDIGRRLRLMPRESVEVLFWPEAGAAGWLSETNLRAPVRVRWRLLQAYVNNPRGGMEAGPMALTANTNTVIRAALPEARLPVAELAERIKTAPGPELPALVTAARAQLYAQAEAPRRSETPAPVTTGAAPPPSAFGADPGQTPLLTAEERSLLAAAATERYSKSDPILRSLLLAGLPAAWKFAEMQPLDDAAAVDSDPACRCLHIVTRVTKSNDPALAAGTTFSDAQVRDIARMQSDRLAAAEAAAVAAQSQQQQPQQPTAPGSPR
jgi:tetratricopeptide (TPR) repeat protein